MKRPRSHKWSASVTARSWVLPPSVMKPSRQACGKLPVQLIGKHLRTLDGPSADAILKVIYLFYWRSWLPFHPSSCSTARFCPLMCFVAFLLPLARVWSRAWPEATGAFAHGGLPFPVGDAEKSVVLEFLSAQDASCWVCHRLFELKATS